MKKTLLLLFAAMGVALSLHALKPDLYTSIVTKANMPAPLVNTISKKLLSRNKTQGFGKDTVVHLASVAQMIAYADSATSVILSDTLQGGASPFVYQPA